MQHRPERILVTDEIMSESHHTASDSALPIASREDTEGTDLVSEEMVRELLCQEQGTVQTRRQASVGIYSTRSHGSPALHRRR